MSKAKQRKEKQSKAKRRKAKQSQAKQSKAKQSNAKQSRAKSTIDTVLQHRKPLVGVALGSSLNAIGKIQKQ